MNTVNRLQLNNNEVCDHQIKRLIAYWMILVGHSDRHLTLEHDAAERQFVTQCLFVESFEQAGPERGVNLDRGSDDLLGQSIPFCRNVV